MLAVDGFTQDLQRQSSPQKLSADLIDSFRGGD